LKKELSQYKDEYSELRKEKKKLADDLAPETAELATLQKSYDCMNATNNDLDNQCENVKHQLKSAQS